MTKNCKINTKLYTCIHVGTRTVDSNSSDVTLSDGQYMHIEAEAEWPTIATYGLCATKTCVECKTTNIHTNTSSNKIESCYCAPSNQFISAASNKLLNVVHLKLKVKQTC